MFDNYTDTLKRSVKNGVANRLAHYAHDAGDGLSELKHRYVDRYTHREAERDHDDVHAARLMGLASIGIGLAELLATKPVQKLMGIDEGPTKRDQTAGVLRAMGVREIMHGVDILSHKDPTPGLWGRVAGDVLDTALLGVAAMKTKAPGRFALVAGTVLAIGVADALLAGKLSVKPKPRRRSWLSSFGL